MKGVIKATLLALALSFGSLAMAQDVAPINVNTADAELLTELPGVGPSRAQAIIEYREANGNFESADDLTQVSGIGPATVDSFRDQVTFQ
ncbi:ComEA family DNA-binding protein [Billgrantia tianxiuensis]|jgi:competence protein ComEA|uniref:ComEA family DNA-binding protein n=1 Tax=Billgrantia tianxiuensis TaxID=2497861 RepID=A0A6I6SHB4_9GAMM|nr:MULTISPECIES: ComEA family DNA-binding protein [Halomonas]MCE8032060.1 ComEA family DNA-binding protein [Halomonas sp. MCCC 1A11057]QHC49899.1 ComEA family DNA-binding protein [Halomonas tianxiuensis]